MATIVRITDATLEDIADVAVTTALQDAADRIADMMLDDDDGPIVGDLQESIREHAGMLLESMIADLQLRCEKLLAEKKFAARVAIKIS